MFTEMNKLIILFLGGVVALSAGAEPFKPYDKSLPFLISLPNFSEWYDPQVYYTSRYRGLCVGVLVSRAAVLTAAVCVTDPVTSTRDTRPVTVVVGSSYRHPRRGIRVQITKIIIPKMPSDLSYRAHLLEKSMAVLLMKRRVPDILAETPPRALALDWRGEEPLTLQQECLIPGWHFFYDGDKVYPVAKFLLMRHVRVQFMNIVKMHEWCDALAIKLQKSLANVGYHGAFDKAGMICVKDGMYGAPLVCGGRAVGMLSAPDAQWTNCTGFSNVIHLYNSPFLRSFMACVSKLFVPEIQVDWESMKKAIFDEDDDMYDYVPAMYDKVVAHSDSSSGEL